MFRERIQTLQKVALPRYSRCEITKIQSGQNRKLVIRFAPADEIHILRTPDVQFYLVFLDV